VKKILILVALTAVAALAVMSSAAAGSRDGNGDRIPDKWEKRHDLSLKVVQTRRDQDRDGLNNLGEFRAGTDPRDRDSDDDGVRDGKERPGTVKSFDGTTLVIALFGGGTVEARVTADTEVQCESEDSASTASQGSGSSGRGSGSDRRASDDDQADDRGRNRGDDPAAGTCAAGALRAGAVVKEAKLRATRNGLVYVEIELAT
jgi:hypothetical protein